MNTRTDISSESCCSGKGNLAIFINTQGQQPLLLREYSRAVWLCLLSECWLAKASFIDSQRQVPAARFRKAINRLGVYETPYRRRRQNPHPVCRLRLYQSSHKPRSKRKAPAESLRRGLGLEREEPTPQAERPLARAPVDDRSHVVSFYSFSRILFTTTSNPLCRLPSLSFQLLGASFPVTKTSAPFCRRSQGIVCLFSSNSFL